VAAQPKVLQMPGPATNCVILQTTDIQEDRHKSRTFAVAAPMAYSKTSLHYVAEENNLGQGVTATPCAQQRVRQPRPSLRWPKGMALHQRGSGMRAPEISLQRGVSHSLKYRPARGEVSSVSRSTDHEHETSPGFHQRHGQKTQCLHDSEDHKGWAGRRQPEMLVNDAFPLAAPTDKDAKRRSPRGLPTHNVLLESMRRSGRHKASPRTESVSDQSNASLCIRVVKSCTERPLKRQRRGMQSDGACATHSSVSSEGAVQAQEDHFLGQSQNPRKSRPHQQLQVLDMPLPRHQRGSKNVRSSGELSKASTATNMRTGQIGHQQRITKFMSQSLETADSAVREPAILPSKSTMLGASVTQQSNAGPWRDSGHPATLNTSCQPEQQHSNNGHLRQSLPGNSLTDRTVSAPLAAQGSQLEGNSMEAGIPPQHCNMPAAADTARRHSSRLSGSRKRSSTRTKAPTKQEQTCAPSGQLKGGSRIRAGPHPSGEEDFEVRRRVAMHVTEAHQAGEAEGCNSIKTEGICCKHESGHGTQASPAGDDRVEAPKCAREMALAEVAVDSCPHSVEAPCMAMRHMGLQAFDYPKASEPRDAGRTVPCTGESILKDVPRPMLHRRGADLAKEQLIQSLADACDAYDERHQDYMQWHE
jgi:hypothetical protein